MQSEKYFLLLMATVMILNGVMYFFWPPFRELGMKDPRIIELYAQLEREFGFKTQLLNPWLIGLFTFIGITLLTMVLLYGDPPR